MKFTQIAKKFFIVSTLTKSFLLMVKVKAR